MIPSSSCPQWPPDKSGQPSRRPRRCSQSYTTQWDTITCRCGLTFAIKADTGKERVLTFNDDQSEVASGMTLIGDIIYEAVPQQFGSEGDGNGELVEFNIKSKTSTVLYTFTGGSGGDHPEAPLLYQDGAFYGTTFGYFGGGLGTVFKYVP
jgi:hypothetical protein